MIYQSFMRIYTRRGDGGLTGIHGGHRVPKTDIRIEANGALDELNSIIGVVRSLLEDEPKDAVLRAVQENLMNLMSRVATPICSFIPDIFPRVIPFLQPYPHFECFWNQRSVWSSAPYIRFWPALLPPAYAGLCQEH